jgi:hypothetical protein
MRVFTEVDVNILRHLAHYKYMTLAHLVSVGAGGKSYTSTRIKKLREAGFIGVSQYGGVYKSGGGGRVENINYLTPRGVKLLADNTELEPEQIHHPKNIDGIFRNDYVHRISTVSIHISFELWAKRLAYPVLFFETYFHKVGSAKTAKDDNPLRSITRITFEDGSFIEPDAVFAAERSDKKLCFCLEVHNGADVSRIVEQLKRISRAVSKGLITDHYKQYGIVNSPRVLCAVETENMLRLVQKRICADAFFKPDWMKQVFLFHVAEQVWKDFDAGWQNMEGRTFKLSGI